MAMVYVKKKIIPYARFKILLEILKCHMASQKACQALLTPAEIKEMRGRESKVTH